MAKDQWNVLLISRHHLQAKKGPEAPYKLGKERVIRK
jgi:hypothetical protein